MYLALSFDRLPLGAKCQLTKETICIMPFSQKRLPDPETMASTKFLAATQKTNLLRVVTEWTSRGTAAN